MGSQTVIADGLANLPEAFVWIFIGKHTHFITPKAQIYKMHFWGGGGGSKIHCEFKLFDA